MRKFKISLAIVMLVASMGLAAPASAELLVNEWSPFEFLVPQDPDNPCSDDPAFLAQGMQHVKVSTLPQGGLAINFNALGTFTGLVSGNEWLWRHNWADVLPMDGENAVYNYQETLKIIGQGGAPTYFAKFKFHVAVIGGEVKSYIEVEDITCT